MSDQREKDVRVCDILNLIADTIYNADPSEPSDEYTARMAGKIYRALTDAGYIEERRKSEEAE